MRRVAAGDRAAFRSLVVAHSAAVGRFLHALAPDVADDALKEAFLAAWKHAGDSEGRGSVRSWLITSGRRAALRLRPKETVRDDSADDATLAAQAGWGHAPQPASFAKALESRELLQLGLASLSPTDREAVMLVDVLGDDYDEACAVTGLSLAAFKSRLHRARLRLLAALRPHVTEVPHDG